MLFLKSLVYEILTFGPENQNKMRIIFLKLLYFSFDIVNHCFLIVGQKVELVLAGAQRLLEASQSRRL